METLIFILIVAAIIILLTIKARQGTDSDTSSIKTPIKKEYVYIKKSCAMTPSELSFYKTLHEAINGCSNHAFAVYHYLLDSAICLNIQ